MGNRTLTRVVLIGLISICPVGLTGAYPIIEPYQPEPDEPVRGGITGKRIVNFIAQEESGIPDEWMLLSEETSIQRVSDPGLAGRDYLQLIKTGDGNGLLTIPLQAGEEGRIRLRLGARSPQAVWLQLSATRGSRTLWSQNLPLSSGWQESAWDFVIPPPPEGSDRHPLLLNLRFNGPAGVDLDFLEADFTDLELLREGAARAAAGQIRQNLLRNSRLPLGLASGWTLDRYTDDSALSDIGSTSHVIGPSGFPALGVRSDGAIRFFSEPIYPVAAGETHRASFWVKGEGSGTLRILRDAIPVEGEINFQASDNWQQVTLTFPTRATARTYTLQFDLSGEVWLDQFEVVVGPAATDSVATNPEVALRVERPSQVIFEDEPARMEWMVTGAPGGSYLRAKVVNLAAQQAILKPMALNGLGTESGWFEIDVFPGQSLGSLRVEAWVTDSAGRRISPYNERVFHRIRRPHFLDTFAPDSPFGIHTLPTRRHREMAKAVGLNWVRLHDAGGLEWFHLEREPGNWRFNDETMERFRSSGFEILGLLGTSPLWANAWPGENKELIHSFWDKWGAPGDLEAWARYVEKVTQRYAEYIGVYEVWNEPWIPRFFSGRREPQPRGEPLYFHSETPQKDYAAISLRAAEARGAESAIKLIGLNSTAGQAISNRISGTEWSRGVVEEGGIEGLDFISYHHYTTAVTGYPGDDIKEGFQRAIGPALTEGKPALPVWMTEGSNTPSGTQGTFYHHTFRDNQEVDFAKSADHLVRYMVTMLAAGNEKIFLYSMHTHGILGGSYRFSTLVTPDGYLHPDAVALSNLTWLLEQREFSGLTQGKDATEYYFVGRETAPEGKVTAVLPLPDGPGVIPPDGALNLWGNPTGGTLSSKAFFIVEP